MATVAALEKAIATNERYAANFRKAGKDPAKYLARIAALKVELAALPMPTGNPADGTSGGAATTKPAEDFSVQPADPPEIVFDPSTWPPLATVPGTARAGKYGELFGSAIPGPGVYTDVQTSGGSWGAIPPMFYLFLRGKIIWAQEGNIDPAARIAKKTAMRPANTTGLTF